MSCKPVCSWTKTWREMRIVGMDIHRSFAQVAILEDGEIKQQLRVDLVHHRVVEFAKTLSLEDEVVIEATGNSAAVERLLRPYVKRVAIANPRLVRAIAYARVKTDKIDASILAKLQRVGLSAGDLGSRRRHARSTTSDRRADGCRLRRCSWPARPDDGAEPSAGGRGGPAGRRRWPRVGAGCTAGSRRAGRRASATATIGTGSLPPRPSSPGTITGCCCRPACHERQGAGRHCGPHGKSAGRRMPRHL